MIKIKYRILIIAFIILIFSFNMNADNKVIIIKNVNIIPMNKEIILENMNVLIKNGKIASISESSFLNYPNDSIVINGKNKYLIPGLIDMHAHIFEKNNLILYLVNGVTTIRNMAEFPDPKKQINSIQKKLDFDSALNLKKIINSGELSGPEIIQASYILDGNPPFAKGYSVVVKDAKSAKDFVRDAYNKGYDYIKIYWNLPKDTFYSIIKAANKYNMKVIGHVPFSITLEEALVSGMYSIEHLTGYYDYDDRGKTMKEIAKLTKDNNVYNCPTLTSLKYILPYNEWIKTVNKDENKYISPKIRKIWNNEIMKWDRRIKKNKKNSLGYAGHNMDLFYFIVNQLHKAGAKILLGTDSGMPYIIPGYSIHEELKLLVKSGLSPYDAIKAGTKDAAICLEKQNEIGTVETGKEADLILLNDNPLKNIKNTKKISGIISNGKWFPRIKLDQMLKKIEN